MKKIEWTSRQEQRRTPTHDNAQAASQLKTGLRGKIVAAVIIPLILLLTTTGLYLTKEVREIVEDLKTTDIIAQTEAAANQVEAFFDPYITSSKMVRSMDAVQQLFEEVDAGGASFDITESAYFAAAMAELKDVASQQDSSLQAAWLSTFASSQIFQSDDYISEDGWDVMGRAWYPLVQKSGGEPILTPAYVDSSTGKQIVSAVCGVFNSRGEMIGASGMDITLDALSTQMAALVIGEEGYITVYDTEQNVVYNPDSSLLLANVDEVGYSDEMLTPLKALNTMSNIVEYERNGVSYHGRTVYLDALDWQVLGCMTTEEFDREQKSASIMVTSSFGACIILLFLICIFVSTAIVRPLKRLDQVASRLAQGDLDVEVNVNTHDEVGDLAHNISLVVDRLKTYIAYIGEVSDILDNFGRGNLVFDLKHEYVGEFNRLKVAMQNIQEQLSTTLFQIVDAAAQVDSGSNQIADASQSMAQGATEQASAVEELAATIADINSKVKIASENAETANRFTQEAEMGVTQSNNYMKELMSAMNDIQATSNEINKIIKSIDDIAFQTNILALNAAVEAARAGAAGKGFAVVADEVRNLAAKSAEAAKSTTTLIENSMNAVQIGMQHARATSEAIIGVAEKSAITAEKMQEISTATAEQSAAIAQLSAGIDQIASVTQTNSATAEETAAASEELSGQARLMNELTMQFHMDERFHR